MRSGRGWGSQGEVRLEWHGGEYALGECQSVGRSVGQREAVVSDGSVVAVEIAKMKRLQQKEMKDGI